MKPLTRVTKCFAASMSASFAGNGSAGMVMRFPLVDAVVALLLMTTLTCELPANDWAKSGSDARASLASFSALDMCLSLEEDRSCGALTGCTYRRRGWQCLVLLAGFVTA